MALARRVVSAVVRPLAAVVRVRAASTAAAGLDPIQITYPINRHRSNAQELIAKVPVIEVPSGVVNCDGGGGATGHPIEFIKLDRRAGSLPAVCKYCGLRYKMAEGAHHHH